MRLVGQLHRRRNGGAHFPLGALRGTATKKAPSRLQVVNRAFHLVIRLRDARGGKRVGFENIALPWHNGNGYPRSHPAASGSAGRYCLLVTGTADEAVATEMLFIKSKPLDLRAMAPSRMRMRSSAPVSAPSEFPRRRVCRPKGQKDRPNIGTYSSFCANQQAIKSHKDIFMSTYRAASAASVREIGYEISSADDTLAPQRYRYPHQCIKGGMMSEMESTKAYWSTLPWHRQWLVKAGGRPVRLLQVSRGHPPGRLLRSRPARRSPLLRHPVRGIHASARMVHCFSIGHLLGRPGCGDIVDHGMTYLWDKHRDQEHGGYFWQVDDNGLPTLPSKVTATPSCFSPPPRQGRRASAGRCHVGRHHRGS